MKMATVIRKVYRKTYRAVHVDGVIGTSRLAVERIARCLHHRKTSGPIDATAVSTFDSTWNVQTDGIEDLSELNLIDRTNYLFGNRYEATAPEMVERMIRAVPVPYEQYTFIDCGSGKGRVLLVASEFPFRRIIGVEFSTELTDVARANIRAYKSPTRKCRQVEALCVDATVYPFPPEPTILFIFNPFEGPVMEKFIRRIEDSLEQAPRDFFVLYRNPKLAGLWNRSKYFENVHSSNGCEIYKNVTCSPALDRPMNHTAHDCR